MPGGFCVSNGPFVNIAPGADFEKRLEDAILDQELTIGEHDLHCYVETSRMSLSPMAECDEPTAEEMYRLTLRSSDAPEVILHEVSADQSIRISFGIDKELHNFLVRTFQYVVFHHPIIGIIDMEAERQHTAEDWMTVAVSHGTLSIAAYRDHRLHLANCIETMVTQNRAYHVLNTWTRLDFDALNDILYIIGDEQEVLKLRNAVATFIKLCE